MIDEELTPRRKSDLMRTAAELADELDRGSATRSECRHVIDTLFLSHGDFPQRLAKAREITDALPDSWLKARGQSTVRKLTQVKSTFRRVLRERYDERELRFLLGWTARILHTWEKEKKRENRSRGRGSNTRSASKYQGKKTRSQRPRRQ